MKFYAQHLEYICIYTKVKYSVQMKNFLYLIGYDIDFIRYFRIIIKCKHYELLIWVVKPTENFLSYWRKTSKTLFHSIKYNEKLRKIVFVFRKHINYYKMCLLCAQSKMENFIWIDVARRKSNIMFMHILLVSPWKY